MLASIFSLNVLQTALELGCIYALRRWHCS